MTQEVNVAWGVCAPMRYKDHVEPIIENYGVKVLGWNEYEEPGYGTGVKVKVSDAQAAYAEYWLCRCGLFSIVGKMHNPVNKEYARKWQTIPMQKGCNAHTQAGTVGKMPTPWSESKGKRQPRQRRNKRTRQGDGILDTLARWLR